MRNIARRVVLTQELKVFKSCKQKFKPSVKSNNKLKTEINSSHKIFTFQWLLQIIQTV